MNHPTTMGDPRGPPIFYGKPLRVRNKEKISQIGVLQIKVNRFP